MRIRRRRTRLPSPVGSADLALRDTGDRADPAALLLAVPVAGVDEQAHLSLDSAIGPVDISLTEEGLAALDEISPGPGGPRLVGRAAGPHQTNSPTRLAESSETRMPATSIRHTLREITSFFSPSTSPFRAPMIMPTVERFANEVRNTVSTAWW